jgi:hypothetical protein
MAPFVSGGYCGVSYGDLFVDWRLALGNWKIEWGSGKG